MNDFLVNIPCCAKICDGSVSEYDGLIIKFVKGYGHRTRQINGLSGNQFVSTDVLFVITQECNLRGTIHQIPIDWVVIDPNWLINRMVNED